MKHFVMSLFAENGSVSMVRFMALLSLIMACVLAYQGKDNVAVFVGAAFGAKIIQKRIELDGSKSTTEISK